MSNGLAAGGLGVLPLDVQGGVGVTIERAGLQRRIGLNFAGLPEIAEADGTFYLVGQDATGAPRRIALDLVPGGGGGGAGVGVDASGPLSSRAAYDAADGGFVYLSIDGAGPNVEWTLYIKNSAAIGDWSLGKPIRPSPATSTLEAREAADEATAAQVVAQAQAQLAMAEADRAADLSARIGSLITRMATVAIPPWRVLRLADDNTFRVADAQTQSHQGRVVGVTAFGGGVGASVIAQGIGDLLGPAHGLPIGATLFVGPSGALVTTPPEAGWRQIVGTVVTSTRILVALGEGSVAVGDGDVSTPDHLRALVGGKPVDLPTEQALVLALSSTSVEIEGVSRTFGGHITALHEAVGSFEEQVFDFSLDTAPSLSDDWSN